MLPAIPMFDPFRRPNDPPRSAWPWRAAVLGAITAILIVIASQLAVICGDNFHAVVPGRVYRSAQLPPTRLAEHVRANAVRTVVNLRGCCDDFQWYRDELCASHVLGTNQEDIYLSANRLPPPSEVRRLIEVLDRAERPLLIHCRRGVDRTGVAAVAARLLDSRYSYSDARNQLGLWYGHAPINGTEAMDRFFSLYENWLARVSVAHTPAVFRHWATREYCPGPCRATLENLSGPLSARPGEACRFQVRVRNTSVETWQLHPGTGTGVHARWTVVGMNGVKVSEGYAGLFEARVPVGEAIELDVAIPPLRVPGVYSVCVDLADGAAMSFLQAGSEPLLVELHVE